MTALDDLEARLRDHRSNHRDEPRTRRSAVAVVLRFGVPGPEVLLMTRTVHEADPWSGQVALPGGRHEPEDPDLLATAIRETHEEVGLDLGGSGELLTRFAPIQARARGGKIDMDVTPFAFRFDGGVEPVAGPEASEVFWMPLTPVVAGELDGHYPYERAGVVHELPSWHYEGRVVWGLTYRMLRGMLEETRLLRP